MRAGRRSAVENRPCQHACEGSIRVSVAFKEVVPDSGDLPHASCRPRTHRPRLSSKTASPKMFKQASNWCSLRVTATKVDNVTGEVRTKQFEYTRYDTQVRQLENEVRTLYNEGGVEAPPLDAEACQNLKPSNVAHMAGEPLAYDCRRGRLVRDTSHRDEAATPQRSQGLSNAGSRQPSALGSRSFSPALFPGSLKR